MKASVVLIFSLSIYGFLTPANAQKAGSSLDLIIEKIANLESSKDPKCYATANRLEDFMYGTPLSEPARNLRIEVQKEISLYVRILASEIARSDQNEVISDRDILSVIDSMATVGRLQDGDFFFQADSMILRIRKIDFDQYSSVAYSFRSLLSVEQDLFFIADGPKLLSLNESAVETLNGFLNLSTLASLNMADFIARERQLHEISEEVMRESWIRILSRPQNQALFAFQYPSQEAGEQENNVLKQIIRQKINAYDQYNQLSTSVFLRNIQVFFAKQKWPTDEDLSTEMKNYLLESLIAFCKELIIKSEVYSTARKDVQIRIRDVQQAVQLFLPFAVNDFEDITYFPNDELNALTIESYDLDAFRDGGIHWRVLDYALEDPEIFKLVIDPTAAELVVEAIAQLGVLVLRVAGAHSHQQQKEVLTIKDIESAFHHIQTLITNYPSLPDKAESKSAISSNTESAANASGKFQDVTDRVSVQFEHRSADWLSRFIRSYVYSAEDTLAKLAIPPAFGGSGVAAEDINNDGLTDLLLLGGLGNRLYLNGGEKFTDITDQVPLNIWNEEKKSFGEARQPIIADFDNDGLQDIFITFVDEWHRMLKNTDGTHFEDVSEIANLDGRGMVAGPATALDYDNDGLLDIFIGYFGNYLKGVLPTLSRHNQNGMRNRLYKNLGDFTFKEVMFTPDSLTDNGWTQALGHTDINQDGRQDLIVGNDFGVNRYYLNDLEKGFIEMSKLWKTDKPSYTMNVGIGDLNNDQYPDLYISNIVVMQKEEKYISPNEETTMKFDPEKMQRIRTVEANDLFLSHTENGQFVNYDLSDEVGRGFASTGWSWDADFFDFDNDGDEDLYCLNGMNDFRVYSTENPFYYGTTEEQQAVSYAESDRERNVFFVNEQGVLTNKASELGADLLSNSRSASYLDFDNDGDLDIIINNYHDKAVLLENTLEGDRNWIKIKLVGDPAQGVNLDAIGTSITLNPEGDKRQWREVHSTSGYLSVHPKEQHFGLGKDEEVSLEIKWPNGEIRILPFLQKNRNYLIKYPNFILN